MSNQRSTFAKREREMKLKDKARAKAERRAAKRTPARSDDTADNSEEAGRHTSRGNASSGVRPASSARSECDERGTEPRRPDL